MGSIWPQEIVRTSFQGQILWVGRIAPCHQILSTVSHAARCHFTVLAPGPGVAWGVGSADAGTSIVFSLSWIWSRKQSSMKQKGNTVTPRFMFHMARVWASWSLRHKTIQLVMSHYSHWASIKILCTPTGYQSELFWDLALVFVLVVALQHSRFCHVSVPLPDQNVPGLWEAKPVTICTLTIWISMADRVGQRNKNSKREGIFPLVDADVLRRLMYYLSLDERLLPLWIGPFHPHDFTVLNTCWVNFSGQYELVWLQIQAS